MSRPELHPPDVRPARDVLLVVEGLSKAAPKPPAQPPRWLARFLPGVQWSALADQEPDEEDDDADEEDREVRRQGSLQELSFELAAGEGLGLIGDDKATRTLLKLLLGLYPPSTGRITIRGRIAPLLRFSELNFSGGVGKGSLRVISGILHWPSGFLRSRWDEIVDFAHLEEVEELGFPPDSIEYDEARTKRLLLSAIMHLDATIYAVLKGFAGTDSAMFDRCSALLEERQRDGCAILHTGRRPEDVARFCRDAIYFEGGAPIYQGRLGAVATVIVERRAAAKVNDERRVWMPFRPLLISDDGAVALGPDGGTIEIELDAFRPKVALLRLRFADGAGWETETEYRELFEAEPGIYRIRITVPAGLLDDGVYTATLIAASVKERIGAEEPPPDAEESPEDGQEPTGDSEAIPPPVELLSFEVSSQSDADDTSPTFDRVADDRERAAPQDVEWDVSGVDV